MIKQYVYESKELLKLIVSCVANEGYNGTASHKLAYYKGNELLGICVFDVVGVDRNYIQFHHVYVRPDKQGGMTLFRMLKEMYKFLKSIGFGGVNRKIFWEECDFMKKSHFSVCVDNEIGRVFLSISVTTVGFGV